MAWAFFWGGAHSPGVEEESTGEGENQQDDGQVKLELLILSLVGKPKEVESLNAVQA